MNTRKLFLTSLLAAATMISVPAWADEITSDGRTISTDTSVDQIYFSANGTLTIDAGAALTITGSKAKAESANSAAADRSSFSFGDTSRATINVNGTLNLLAASGFGTVWGTMGMIVENGGVANLKALTVSAVWTNNNSSSVTLETGGTLNLGEGGYKKQYVGASYDTSVINLTLNGGTLGALDSWSTSDALTASGNVTINTTKYDATNKAYLSGDGAGATISANGGLAGTGKFIISGLGSVSTTNVSVASLEIASGASMTISGALSSASVANAGTLTLTNATATFGGTVTNTSSLDLSGANVTLTNAIANSGTVTISETTVFNLTKLGATTLIDGGTIAGVDWNSLTGFNFTYNGAAVVGRGLTSSSSSVGVVSYDANATAKTLTWNGGGSAVWKAVTITETSPATPWLDGSTAEAFYSGDTVLFSAANASVEVSGTVDPAAMTVSAATSFTGTGTISVAVANLTTSAAMTLDKNVVLDLGNISAETTVNNVVGTGTVKVVSTADGHGATLRLDADFTGTIDYSGKFNTSNGTVNMNDGTANSNAKFALSNGSMWGGGATNTLANDIHFLTDYQIGDSTATTIALNGNLTQADGTTLTVGGTNPTVTFGGTVELSNLKQTSGTATFNGKTTLGMLNVTNGTTNFTGATNITSATVTGGTLKFDFGALNNAATFSSASTLAVNGGTAIFGYASGAGGTITGDSFGQNLSIVVGSGAQMTIAITNGNEIMKAFSGNLTLKDGATYSKFDGGVELAGNVTLGEADSDVVYLLGTWGKLGTKISGALSGSGTAYFGKNSGGPYDTNTEVLTISGSDNSYSGEIVVGKKDAGTNSARNTELVLSTATALQNGKVNLAGSAAGNYAQLTLGANEITIAGLSGTEFGKVALGSGVSSSTLTVNQATKTTFAGTLAAGIALLKDGTGTLTLSGNNAANTNGVTISGGKLIAAHESALGTGKTTVESGAKLGLVAGTTVKVTNGIDLADGAKIVVDMTSVVAGTAEKIVLTLVSETALNYNETGSFDTTEMLGSVVVLENLSETLRAWTQSLSYSGNTLRLTMTIPEPSTFGLLAGLGALALAGTRRRRRKA